MVLVRAELVGEFFILTGQSLARFSQCNPSVFPSFILLSLLTGSPLSSDSGARAWVAARHAPVRASPDRTSPIIGFADLGSELSVDRCFPTCEAPDGWALLLPRGTIHLSLLAFAAPYLPRDEKPFVYGKLGAKPVKVRSAPHPSSRVLRVRDAGASLAFFDDSLAPNPDWLEPVRGGFIPRASVTLFVPSLLTGEHEPVLPLAFVLRDMEPAPDSGLPAFQRFDRSPVVASRGKSDIELVAGIVPRKNARIAFLRPRPSNIPEGAKWIHVDLREQVLTAYEGDVPVLATLVSTGKPGFATRTGAYSVWLKMRHGDMHGRREPYDVEEVPSVLFFHGSEALHGTFWHSRFGSPASHGCVNLSLSDAAWLFEWAPPALPAGWHEALPNPAIEPTLFVVVERARNGPLPPARLAPALAELGSRN